MFTECGLLNFVSLSMGSTIKQRLLYFTSKMFPRDTQGWIDMLAKHTGSDVDDVRFKRRRSVAALTALRRVVQLPRPRKRRRVESSKRRSVRMRESLLRTKLKRRRRGTTRFAQPRRLGVYGAVLPVVENAQPPSDPETESLSNWESESGTESGTENGSESDSGSEWEPDGQSSEEVPEDTDWEPDDLGEGDLDEEPEEDTDGEDRERAERQTSRNQRLHQLREHNNKRRRRSPLSRSSPIAAKKKRNAFVESSSSDEA